MLLATRTGSGLSVLVTERSARALTPVVSVSALFAAFVSVVVEATVAVLVIVPPWGTLELTFTTSVNVAVSPAARVAAVAVTVPVPPAGGVVGVNPAGAAKDTNVVPTGMTSVSVTF